MRAFLLEEEWRYRPITRKGSAFTWARSNSICGRTVNFMNAVDPPSASCRISVVHADEVWVPQANVWYGAFDCQRLIRSFRFRACSSLIRNSPSCASARLITPVLTHFTPSRTSTYERASSYSAVVRRSASCKNVLAILQKWWRRNQNTVKHSWTFPRWA